MIESEQQFGDEQPADDAADEAAAGNAESSADESSDQATSEAAGEPVGDAAEAPSDASAEAGEGILGKLGGMLPQGALGKATELLDRDGDGNPLNDLSGLAGKFLNRN